MNGGRLIQVFQDIDMRMSFDGLGEIARKSKIKLHELAPGEYVVFFNTAKTYLKLATANNVIAARRMGKGRFYDLGCIVGVVRAFHNTGEIQYEKVLRERITKLLARKRAVIEVSNGKAKKSRKSVPNKAKQSDSANAAVEATA